MSEIAFTITSPSGKFAANTRYSDFLGKPALWSLCQQTETKGDDASPQVCIVVNRVWNNARVWLDPQAIPSSDFEWSSDNVKADKLAEIQEGTNLYYLLQTISTLVENESYASKGALDKAFPSYLSNDVNIDLSGKAGKMTDIPAEISQFKNQVKDLKLAGNKLFKIPQAISQLTSLEELDLSDNELTHLESLPTSLGYLNLSQNPNLKSLEGIQKLNELTQLDISHTGITQMPNWFWTLKWDQKLTILISAGMEKLLEGHEVPANVRFVDKASKNELKGKTLDNMLQERFKEGRQKGFWQGIGLSAIIVGAFSFLAFLWKRWARA